MDLQLIIPELYQTFLALFIFVYTLKQDGGEKTPSFLPVAVWISVLAALAGLSARGMLAWDTYQVDGLSQFFKLAISVGYAVAMQNALRQPTLETKKRADYFLLLTLSSLGLMLMSSAVELITLVLALELSSYSLYALIPLRSKDKDAAEAGIKYILFGAAVTALALFGLSYVMTWQHTTYLAELANKPWSVAENPMAVIGLTLFLGSFFYKLALFPFHFWCPDVYQGASNETAAFVATLPKLGAVVVLVRLAALLSPGLEITHILAVLGALSMTYGNLAALAQSDVKRILGYSSVSHAGYVMIGLVSGTPQGLAASTFYSLIYILMNLAVFWVVCKVSQSGENVTLDDLNGLHRRAPGLAVVLAISAFALVGLPPTAGFTGKLFLLSSAWNHGYNWLVVVAVLNTAISIYYYLNLVRHAYTGESTAPDVIVGRGSMTMAGLLATAILILGAMPGPIYELALSAGMNIMP